VNNITTNTEEIKHKTIVKLSTQYYKDNNSAYIKKVLTRLKRKSTGYDLLLEECDNTGCEYMLSGIVNLFEVPDGIYELCAYNIEYNYFTGYIDDLEYILKEYKENK
jgi:hypothetical protein